LGVRVGVGVDVAVGDGVVVGVRVAGSTVGVGDARPNQVSVSEELQAVSKVLRPARRKKARRVTGR
ncbi:hypothetical protein ACFLT5_03510, partial [Chloroflexota bacterium]